MTLYYADDTVALYHGDCIEVMRSLPDASVDSVVTDPPYGLEFMGKDWDAPWKTPGVGHGARVAQARASEMTPRGVGHQSSKGPYLAARVDSVRVAGPAFQSWCEEWARECLRVLKPGGHMLAFGGTRTWHRLACAVEDAGFEIRDSIAWLHSQGFPKNLNASKVLLDRRCQCDEGECERGSQGLDTVEQGAGADMPGVRDRLSPLADEAPRRSTASVLAAVSGEARRRPVGSDGGEHEGPEANRSEVRTGQPGMEGRCDLQAPEGELCGSALRALPTGVPGDGKGRRIRDGASASDGAAAGALPVAVGSGEPHQPRPAGQPTRESGAVPVERGSQAWGGWPLCGRCGKPTIPDGLGTALKPAFEPIVVARKPLAGTVAANVLTHGTGALNIDGCRIETTEPGGRPHISADGGGNSVGVYGDGLHGSRNLGKFDQGRWPANVVLDETQAAALDEQSGEASYNPPGRFGTQRVDSREQGSTNIGPRGEGDGIFGYGDRGGASRFFYVAKADASERPRYKREGGSDNATTYGQMKKRECNVCGNRTCPAGGEQSGKPWPTCGHDDWSWVEQQSARDEFVAHPTVKPLSLMRWLVRLVTPPGGTVLEPFAGSGTTVEACIIEGLQCIAIEKSDEYLPLIESRITRRRDPVRHVDITGDDLGLFEFIGGEAS